MRVLARRGSTKWQNKDEVLIRHGCFFTWTAQKYIYVEKSKLITFYLIEESNDYD